jgi:glutathionylspermidine synthase
MDINIFDCPQREQLYRGMNFPWYNISPFNKETGLPIDDQLDPYALYYCHQVSQKTIREIQQASVLVGRVFLEAWSIIRGLDEASLLYYGFPQETIKLVKYDSLAPFCMRLDWCWNEETGVKKIVETNAQTPSFWFECTEGNTLVAEHFGLNSTNIYAQINLRLSLNQNIQKAALHLNKPLTECTVAFTALNNAEDLGTIRWLSSYFQGKSEVFGLENLRIKDGEYLFNVKTGKPIDILFLWYPVEWVIEDVDENGQKLWPALEQLILEKKVVIVNFGSAFALQPKSILALINDLGYDFFGEENAGTILDYFPKTAMSSQEIGNSYFAKPILGRQGEGSFAVDSGSIITTSKNNEPWYTKQNYVYQELLDFPTIELAEESMSVVWGAWLYNNGSNQLIPGGIGMRVSEGEITDDYAYWCPLGC